MTWEINNGQSVVWVQKGQSNEQMKHQHKGIEEEAQSSASNEAASGVTDEGALIRRHQRRYKGGLIIRQFNGMKAGTWPSANNGAAGGVTAKEGGLVMRTGKEDVVAMLEMGNNLKPGGF